jgi:hypothetical protein
MRRGTWFVRHWSASTLNRHRDSGGVCFALFAAGHFAPTLASYRMGDHRAISAWTKIANFASVRSAFTGIDPGS